MAGEPDPAYAAKIDATFGTRQWRELWDARYDGAIDTAQFRAELVNLMRWRLERDLGYRTTIPLEFTNTNRSSDLTVIIATSNDMGEKIMADVFAKHGVALECMRRLAQAERQLKKEDPGLFSANDIADMLMSGTEGREPLLPPIEPMRYSATLCSNTRHLVPDAAIKLAPKRFRCSAAPLLEAKMRRPHRCTRRGCREPS